MPSRRRSRPSVVLLTVLVCALAVGAAASLLVGARSVGPPPPSGPTTELYLPGWAISATLIGFALVIIVPILYLRLTSKDAGTYTTPFAVTALALLLAGVAFAAVLHALTPGQPATGAEGPPPPGTTSGNNSTGSTNVTHVTGPGGVLGPFGVHFPPWIWFAVVAGVLLVVAVLALPPLADYLRDRREDRLYRERTDRVATEVRDALRQARQELEGARDPRAIILALYARLLARLAPLVVDLEHATPEEIRHLHLVRLGIRASAARTLTRTFEEARYSSHPLGPEQVAKAEESIREAEEDLTRALGAT